MTNGPRFEVVYNKLALPLTKFIVKRVGGDMKAVDDVVSDTMVAAWKSWHTFKHKSSYFTWLCRIALNKIADYYHDQINSRSRFVVPIIDAITSIDSKNLAPEEEMALNELRKSVNDCLDLLPPEKRRLLQFRYWYNLSYSQMARLMGTTPRSIEGKLYRAKHDFASVWSQMHT